MTGLYKLTSMQSETFYHIYNHANGFENLFQKEDNYRYFLQQWGKYITPVADTYAYCLMPNHFHFLIRTKADSVLLDLQGFKNLGGLERSSKIITQHFSNLFNSYTKAYNKMYERKGSLFMSNFKHKEIKNNDYLTNVIFYIHHNPVHHGFVDTIQEWPHSSYHSLLSTKTTLLKRRAVHDYFGGISPLILFHQQPIKQLEALEMEYT